MSANWDVVTTMVRSWLDEYSTGLKREVPSLRFQVGGRVNEVYLLDANVSLSATGVSGVEDLALEFGVRREGGQLVMATDVVQGEIQFAAFAPESRIEEDGNVVPWLLRGIADGMDFLVSERQNLIEALRTALPE